MQKCSSGRDSFDVVVDPDGSKSSYRTSKKASNEAAIRPAQILPDDEAVEPFGFIGVCSISMELKTNTEMLHWWWNRHSFFQFKIHTFDDSFVVSVTKETGFDSCLTQNVDLPFTKVVLMKITMTQKVIEMLLYVAKFNTYEQNSHLKTAWPE